MLTKHDRNGARARRHRRVRKRVTGSANRPRLAVHRSLRHITAQVVDDGAGHTMAAASSHEAQIRDQISGSRNLSNLAEAVGRVVAGRAREAGVSSVVFDRGGYVYHGRVKALADAARGAGLEF
ncbi:MAG: 50S ribosomal protein L18 [Candidatus Dormibacteria bacterium]